MSKLNDHIEEYLNYYLNLKGAPGFAVLLSGEWGCGKTWFIKHFISSYETRGLEPLRFLYITLYGVTATAEIEDQLFQQLHPVLASQADGFGIENFEGISKDKFEDRPERQKHRDERDCHA